MFTTYSVGVWLRSAVVQGKQGVVSSDTSHPGHLALMRELVMDTAHVWTSANLKVGFCMVLQMQIIYNIYIFIVIYTTILSEPGKIFIKMSIYFM